IFFESGDHRRTGRSLLIHPALSVAYPKSFTPSLVSCVSFPEAASRTQRLESRMNAARFRSGERTLFGISFRFPAFHREPWTSQVQRRLPILKAIARFPSSKVNCVKGNRNGS